MQDFVQLVQQNLFRTIATLLTAAIGAYFAFRVSRSNRHAVACTKFRAAVHASLIGLYPTPSKWPVNKLKIIDDLEGRYAALESAVSEFMPHLPILQRWRFNRAWQFYRIGEQRKQVDGQNYWQYVPISVNGIFNNKEFVNDNRSTYQTNFKHNVERLLSFAKET